METKVNLILLTALGVSWGAVNLAEPAAALDPEQHDVEALADLEDRYAAGRDDPELAGQLAEEYLRLGSPQLAAAAIHAASPEVRESPAILHRLAQAYEETGEMEDALATARLALARCARALGTSGSSPYTQPPAHRCSERTYAALDVHANALGYMARWGVTEVQTDPRARTAYALSVRSARILSASAE